MKKKRAIIAGIIFIAFALWLYLYTTNSNTASIIAPSITVLPNGAIVVTKTPNALPPIQAATTAPAPSKTLPKGLIVPQELPTQISKPKSTSIALPAYVAPPDIKTKAAKKSSAKNNSINAQRKRECELITDSAANIPAWCVCDFDELESLSCKYKPN